MTEQAKVPSIRFAGFTDPWEQRKFSELASLRRGLTYSPADIRPYGQGIRVLRSSNIDEDEFTLSNEDVFVDETVVGIELVQEGEILITAANGSPRLVGKRAIINGLTGKTVHGGFMLCAHAEQPDYVAALMGSRWYQHFLATGVAGGNGSIGNLDKAALEDEFAFVPSIEEQELIGVLFSRLDDLITLHQRKYDKLVVFKKSMFEKMFPKDGESVPEIRFAGFTDPWEQRKFSELASLRRGLTYSPADIRPYGQGIRVLRSSNIDEDEFTLSNEDVFVDETVVGIELVQEGEILITAANGSPRLVGKRAIINGLTGKTVHGGFMLCAHAEQPDYVAALMGSRWYQHFLATGVAGGNGSIGNLDKAALEDEFAFVPSIEEQELIGVLFSRLDDLITLHQRKLELLRNIKKSLLDKMFV